MESVKLFKEKKNLNKSIIFPLGKTSSTFKAPHIFVKYIIKFLDYDVYEREKYFSSILCNFSWHPKLLYCNDNEKYFIYENVGEVLTSKNKPKDLEEQFNIILFDMKKLNIKHNDIKNGELLVDKNGKIYLCDFGWATINNELGCGKGFWNKKKPSGILDDFDTLNRLHLINSSSPEIHLLIDWTCSFKKLEKAFINSLKLIHKLNLDKFKEREKTISQFYNCKINDLRGDTKFNLFIIQDNNPIYEFRKTSKGNRKVNINIFDLKMKLRNIIGSNIKIHATDNIQETKNNLKTLGLFEKYYKQKKFNSLQDVFDELNKHNKLKWVVLRNFEEMPDNINIDEHLDVDLLVNNYFLVKSILDGFSSTNNRYDEGGERILNYVLINNKKVLFDFRFVGDNYYCKKLQEDILNSRIKHPKGFYIPNPDMHLNSLIYHAIIHKPKISETYIKVFKKYGFNDDEINKKCFKEKLDIFMKKNNYEYCKPESSVGFFLQ